MDTILKSLERAPDLLAIVIITLAFLKFLKAILESHAVRTKEFIETVKEMSADHARVQARSNDLTEKNITALTTNTTATIEVSRTFREFSCKYPKPQN